MCQTCASSKESHDIGGWERGGREGGREGGRAGIIGKQRREGGREGGGREGGRDSDITRLC